MGTALVFEAAHHVDQEVHLPDVPQKTGCQALAPGGALDEAGDVNEFDARRGEALGFEQLAQSARRGSGTGTTPVLGLMVQKG